MGAKKRVGPEGWGQNFALFCPSSASHFRSFDLPLRELVLWNGVGRWSWFCGVEWEVELVLWGWGGGWSLVLWGGVGVEFGFVGWGGVGVEFAFAGWGGSGVCFCGVGWGVEFVFRGGF